MQMNLSKRMLSIVKKRKRRILGLMSGMSMDGIDLADVNCSGHHPEFKAQLNGTFYLPYSAELKQRLVAARDGRVEEVSRLNFLVADEFSKCVLLYLEQNKIEKNDIDAIGSHGQTLYHSTSSETVVHSSLQLGSPSLIAEKTGLLTVGNFRHRDIAAGGQGAPFVPLADYVLHRSQSEPILLINFGSIANVTLITPRFQDVFAFDVGPANMPIDYFASQLSGKDSIDENGSLSKDGSIIEPLLSKLLALPYFCSQPPKAAGYDEFGPKMLFEILQMFTHHSPRDLLRTAVEFSARTLANGIQEHILPRCPALRNVKVSGGGIYNATLLSRVRSLLPSLSIETLSSQFADAKEAMAFAILAHATLSGEPGNVTTATGATKAVVLGEIAV